MSRLLKKFRWDGRRYWMKGDRGWMRLDSQSVAIGIAVALRVTKREGIALRNALKDVANKVQDSDWDEAVDWLAFTKGRNHSHPIGMKLLG